MPQLIVPLTATPRAKQVEKMTGSFASLTGSFVEVGANLPAEVEGLKERLELRDICCREHHRPEPVLQKSIPPQIRQLILYISNDKV